MLELAPLRVVALVLAGGRGRRLYPLTAERSKPSVPFGGKYRIIDFVLSNLVNSGIRSIFVLTQYKAQSLLEHLQMGWMHARSADDFLHAVPAQMQAGASWYRGTADAVYQNLSLLSRTDPKLVAVFGADHIYKMNVYQMIQFHQKCGAAATLACLPVPVESAHEFGILSVDEHWQITGFQEKPEVPAEIPGRPGWALASMGNYIFDKDVLVDAIEADAADTNSEHDIGKSILPDLVRNAPIFAYDFHRNEIPSETDSELGYWRDVGTIEAYYEANLDLKNIQPSLNLYNWNWRIRSVSFNDPPAKFVFDETGRLGRAVQSLVSAGCILAGGYVKDSVLGRNVRIDEGAEVLDSIILDNVRIGSGAKVKRTIIDKNNFVQPNTTLGYDLDKDRKEHFVSDDGIVVLARGEDTRESRIRNL